MAARLHAAGSGMSLDSGTLPGHGKSLHHHRRSDTLDGSSNSIPLIEYHLVDNGQQQQQSQGPPAPGASRPPPTRYGTGFHRERGANFSGSSDAFV